MVIINIMGEFFPDQIESSLPANKKVQVVLKDGSEDFVSKDELQFLLVTRQLKAFERSDGWVVCGRDNNLMRNHCVEFDGKDRREHTVYDYGYWY